MNDRQVQQIEIGWHFWVQWVFGTGVGFLLSLLVVEIGVRPYIGAVHGAIGGTAIAIAQWLVLRQRVSQIGWWILATVVSWVFIGGSGLGALGWIAPRTEQIGIRAFYGFLDGAMVGAFLGLGQWFVLRRYVSKAGWWIVATTVSWAIALPLGWIVGAIAHSFTGLFLGEVMGLAVAWMAIAASTGFALIHLLRRAGRR